MLLFSFFFLLFFISLSVYFIFIHKPKQQVKNSGQKKCQELSEKKCQKLKPKNSQRLWLKEKKMSRTQVRKHVYVKPTIKVVKNLSCHGLQASFQGPGNPGGPGDSGCPILAGLNQSAIASTKEDVSGGAYERGSLSYQVGCLWLISKVLTFLSDTLWLSTYCYFSLVWPVYSFGITIYCFSVVLVYQD
ncbi:hypothetical protein EDC96DRAFT_565993 [Choanephora cucurbitarum]|nr:hypothetical protein EDC96DRAFT_565993 [Choanephora cucurbitarum]